ncbi:CbiQ family ECF transporter T component [Ruania albidiflava]|uniref:CbiQ family ECF transporter T component n=1 Tax=Ruania albidiflava TaxID=366586 RepID=UPI0023F54D70|nr:CbiQ family ECF transporter T component [Ruania albidiflava]
MTTLAAEHTDSLRSTGHPLAWWAWAAGCAVAASRVGNPVVLVLLLLAVVLVALARRPAGPWHRALEAGLVLGAVVVLVRTGFYVLLGLPDSSPVLVTLPVIDLPAWFTNVSLLGEVHVAGLVQAAIAGLALAVLIVTVGAVNSVASPRRALRSLPASLHHLGSAAVIAVSAAPQLLTAVRRVRRAQRLRGQPSRGLRGLAATLIPVLAGALDQALDLAASMDSRGYARAQRGGSRLVGAALIVALLAAAGGGYGLLAATGATALSAVLLAVGLVLAVGASVLAGASVRRTRYRPEPWGWPETVITTCGVLAAALAWAGVQLDPAGLGTWRASTGWPGLPLLALGILAAAAVPALLPDREGR